MTMSEDKHFDFSLFSDRQIVRLMRQVYAEVLERRELAKRAREKHPVLNEATSSWYRNPDNPSETWSGKGRMPSWMRKALASGHDLASILEVD